MQTISGPLPERSPSLRPIQERVVNQADPRADKKVTSHDLMYVVLLSIFGIFSWLAPKKHWPWFADKMASLRVRQRPDLTDAEMAVIRTVIGRERSDRDCETQYRACLRFKYLHWLNLLRCYRPGASDPGGDLVGEQHLRDALADGNGVILWVGTFAFNDLFTKATLYRNGFDIRHLSRPSHGFSSSRFGQAFLNPILTKVESRYLKERIVMGGAKGNRLTDLEDRLAANGIVSITACGLGKRLLVSDFLNGEIQLAVGALKLAHQTGARILPLFTTSRDDGRIVTEIANPLPLLQEAPREEAIQDALIAYLPLLEAQVRRHPEQFCYEVNAPSENLFVLPVK